jgi:hypothetical protein
MDLINTKYTHVSSALSALLLAGHAAKRIAA